MQPVIRSKMVIDANAKSIGEIFGPKLSTLRNSTKLSNMHSWILHCKYAIEDSDNRCRLLSLSFQGNGIVGINKDLSRLEWTLEFRLATISRQGVLLFSGDRKFDFLEVFLHDRIIRVEFSLGGKTKVVKLKGERSNRVNDGEWHTVRIEYYDKAISVLLDECDAFVAQHAHGATPCAAKARMDLPAK
uniref:LAM_G_DOMAIN domain-containing protein n=1 Tax=Heterorhabditis bacteriophora TaxID=37862 RepID=A0A1I7XFH0_HETBA